MNHKAIRMFIKLEERYSNQFTTIVYEALLHGITNAVDFLFKFAGLKVTEQAYSFLEKSTTKSSDDPYGVYRKNKSGYEWKEQLSPGMIRRILNDIRDIKIAQHYGWVSKKFN